MFNKRLTIAALLGVLVSLFWASQSLGEQANASESGEYLDVVQLLGEAGNGNSDAQLSIAYHYLSGEHIEQSDEKAAQWFETAANSGRPEAQTQLGLMYFSGNGVQISQAEAVMWIGKAAAQDYDPALDLLHWMSQAAH
ncbi:sel1 repeat family protein [Vibrio atlanticus]|nr:sel1 repeat family protein [Vibrio atlanticus]